MSSINSIRSLLYRLARILGDISAVSKDKIGKRVTRKITGKATGRVFKKLFRQLLIFTSPTVCQG